VAKKSGNQISPRYKKGSLSPEANAALEVGGKHLITFYQDEIAGLKTRLEVADAEIAIQLAEGKNWMARAEQAEARLREAALDLGEAKGELDQNQIDFKGKDNEIGLWVSEAERYRNQIIAMLHGMAYK
jgi:hypothetical protein